MPIRRKLLTTEQPFITAFADEFVRLNSDTTHHQWQSLLAFLTPVFIISIMNFVPLLYERYLLREILLAGFVLGCEFVFKTAGFLLCLTGMRMFEIYKDKRKRKNFATKKRIFVDAFIF
jgi:hypothetical protein